MGTNRNEREERKHRERLARQELEHQQAMERNFNSQRPQSTSMVSVFCEQETLRAATPL